MRRIFVWPVLAVGLFAAQSSSGDSGKDIKLLNATWLPVAMEQSGAPISERIRRLWTLTIDGDQFTISLGGNTEQRRFKIDPAKKPKSMDIIGKSSTLASARIWLAIYEVNETTLRICCDLEGKKRPTEFKTEKGKHQLVVTCRRMK